METTEQAPQDKEILTQQPIDKQPNDVANESNSSVEKITEPPVAIDTDPDVPVNASASEQLNNKEIIAFLIQKFPRCFIAEGEAKPLKIGIFQDIIQALGNDESISKSKLRSALRQYTTSWRYLYGIKVGAFRVNLQGEQIEILTEEHVVHAQKMLQESKNKAQQRYLQQKELRNKKIAEARQKVTSSQVTQRNEPTTTDNKQKTVKPYFKNKENKENKEKQQSHTAFHHKKNQFKSKDNNGSQTDNKKNETPSDNKQKTPPLNQLTAEQISLGMTVQVNMGHGNMQATVTEIQKETYRVTLDNGLTMKVSLTNLCH